MCCRLRACCICPHLGPKQLFISECDSTAICTQKELLAKPSMRRQPRLPFQDVPSIHCSESASAMAAALRLFHRGHLADHMPARSSSRALDRMASCGILAGPGLWGHAASICSWVCGSKGLMAAAREELNVDAACCSLTSVRAPE